MTTAKLAMLLSVEDMKRFLSTLADPAPGAIRSRVEFPAGYWAVVFCGARPAPLPPIDEPWLRRLAKVNNVDVDTAEGLNQFLAIVRRRVPVTPYSTVNWYGPAGKVLLQQRGKMIGDYYFEAVEDVYLVLHIGVSTGPSRVVSLAERWSTETPGSRQAAMK